MIDGAMKGDLRSIVVLIPGPRSRFAAAMAMPGRATHIPVDLLRGEVARPMSRAADLAPRGARPRKSPEASPSVLAAAPDPR